MICTQQLPQRLDLSGLLLEFRLLLLELRLLSLHFVQQHRVHYLIFHGFNLAIRRPRDQIRIDVRHLFGNQAELRGVEDDAIRHAPSRLFWPEGITLSTVGKTRISE